MELTDLPKNIRRLLLEHWTETEIKDRLDNPEYFFDQVVTPRLDYLKKTGRPTPRIRFSRSSAGEPRVLLIP